MKRISLIMLLSGALVFNSCDSKKEESKTDDRITAEAVPAPVKTNFAAKFPNAADVKWETASEKDQPTYKAKFMKDGKKWKAEFGEDGTFVKDKEDD